MSKFKIGDTIHYMESNKPKSSEIKGIGKFEGNIEMSSFKKSLGEGIIDTVYYTGFYNSVDEANAFGTKEELQQSIFKD